MIKEIRRRSKEEMYPVIEDWQSSRLTKKAYCEQKGIAQPLFFYWQKKYNQEQETGGFLPINIDGENKMSDNGFIEVKHPNGVIICLPGNISTEVIKRCVYL